MHVDEITVSIEQVRGLIVEQAPEWRDRPVEPIAAAGTVNAIFRIGHEFAARFPLTLRQPAELAVEAAAVAEFRSASPIPAPEVVLLGEPGHGYPGGWSVQTWVDGGVPTPTSLQASTRFAADLVTLITALRRWPTRGRTFRGANRGGDLTEHDAWVSECIARSTGLLDTPAMRRMWGRYRDLPRDDADVMSHTDLIPGNLLVTRDHLTGVLDAGDFCAADPALDLVCGWHLLDRRRRAVLRDGLECSDLQWERGQAWAFEQAAGLVWYYRDSNPAMAELGRMTLHRLMTDE